MSAPASDAVRDLEVQSLTWLFPQEERMHVFSYGSSFGLLLDPAHVLF
jgi:hypothetical protein